MEGLIDLMRSANFNCEKTSELLTQEEEGNDDLRMTPLLKAATLGRLSEVKGLLAGVEDANIRSGSQNLSVLDAAALMGHLDLVRFLLEEHGVDVNSACHDGFTALLCAARYGRADLLEGVIDLLVSAGADIDAPMAEGFTPLHLASKRRDCGDVTAILLQRGAAKDALTGNGRSPLHMAAECGNLAATRVLLAAGADATLRAHNGFVNKTPLDFAARSGHVEVIREFARHGVDLDAAHDETGCTALDHASRKNHAGAVDALVEAGARVTPQALDSAAFSLALEAMVALLRHGAPVNATTVTREDGEAAIRIIPTLHIAARRGGAPGAVEMVDLLLRWGADETRVNRRRQTAAEVVGVDVSPARRLAADVDRVRELLANAPADRTWRRRGLLLLCLARNRNRTLLTRRRRVRVRSGGKGKGKGNGADERALAKDGGGDGSGGCAVPSLADVGAAAGRDKRPRTPSKAGDGGGGSGCSWGGGGGEDSENAGGFDGIVSTLMEFEEEGFFRTIVRFL